MEGDDTIGDRLEMLEALAVALAAISTIVASSWVDIILSSSPSRTAESKDKR